MRSIVAALAGVLAITAARACDSPEHRQLDFWLGTWREAGGGDLYRVRRVQDGCGVEEVLIDGGDGTTPIGQGLAGYDPGVGLWRQLWVDRRGQVIAYAGGPAPDGRFVLVTGPDAAGELRRFAQRAAATDEVEASYEASTDGGVTWRPFWHGRYRRVAE